MQKQSTWFEDKSLSYGSKLPRLPESIQGRNVRVRPNARVIDGCCPLDSRDNGAV
jgi:hypothetical protein